MAVSSKPGTVWRRALLSLCALGIALTALNVSMIPRFGFAGIDVQTYRRLSSVNVHSGSSAAGSGLRSGDSIDTGKLSSAERYRWFNYWTFGERMILTVHRAETTLNIPVVATGHWRITNSWIAASDEITWDYWLYLAGDIWICLFAALIAWRRPEHIEAHFLVAMILLIALQSSLDTINWITPWAAFDAIAQAISITMYFSIPAVLATYALLFARPASRLRRLLTWAAYAFAAFMIGDQLVFLAKVWTGWAISPPLSASGSIASWAVWLLPLACLFAAIMASRGAERQRLLWATVSVAPFYAAEVLVNVYPPSGFAGVQILDASTFLLPIGLTYSVLNRRLLDVEFAANRAAVFTAVSLVIIATFVLTEWAIDQWMRDSNPRINMLVSAAVALLLGVSVRAIHIRVERTLDRIFFRKRHEDLRALRRFAHEAPYITDLRVLLERSLDVLREHADAAFALFVLADDRGHTFGEVGENDPAIVALRARHDVLDLQTVHTGLRGEFAYPLVARGRFLGALVVGPKRSHEAYAPDESDAIENLGHAVAAALDVLSVNSSLDVLSAIDRLTHRIDALTETMQSLQAAAGRGVTGVL